MNLLHASLDAGQQMIACFALHVLWQTPLLAGAAWCAVRIGKPRISIAHRLWCGTLLLCVLLPLCSTIAAKAAAVRARREQAVVRLDAQQYAGTLPAFARESRWERFLHRHRSRHDGLQPLSLTVARIWARSIAAGYLIMTLLFMLRRGVSWRRMRQVVQNASREAVPRELLGRLRDHCDTRGIVPPECRMSSDVNGPAIAGVLHPVLLLPSMDAFSAREMDAVFAHELAHLRRHDPLLQALCTALLLPVSFHPGALWIGKRIRHTREMACDAEAARALGSTTTYAESLMRIAERAAPTSPRWSTLSLFNTELLGLFNKHGIMEERMQMLMNGNKGVVRGRAVRVAGCVFLGTAAVLAAGMLQVQPALAGEQTADQSAYIFQVAPSGAANQTSPAKGSAAEESALLTREHAREQLRHAQRHLAEAQHEATTPEQRTRIASARSAVSSAQQALAAAPSTEAGIHFDLHPDLSNLDLPSRDELNAMSDKQREMVRDMQLKFSSPEFKADMARAMQDTHTLRREQNNMMKDLRSGEMHKRLQEQAQQMAHMSFPGLPFVAPAEGQPLKISAGVLASNSVHKENPVYPAEAKQKAIQGAVVLHVLVDEVGKVEQVSLVSSPDPMLTESAIAAVRQWTYKPFLLNGGAVAVESTVTVTYSLAK